MSYNRRSTANKGFTLIELMVSVTIFLAVVFISMGSILGIFDANRKSRSLKIVMSNLNLTLESLSKEMRYGSNYHCGSSGNQEEPRNCPGGDTFISFLSNEDEQITYRLNGSVIEKDVDGTGFVPVTAPEINIEDLSFYTLGAGLDNLLQPKTIILVKGRAGADKGQSTFILQTMISQRKLDML